jgi:alkane 1-monooxygenase
VRSLRYLSGYLVPALAFVAVLAGGAWTVLTPVVAFVLLPMVELLSAGTTANLDAESERREQGDPAYDWALYAAVPVQLALIAAFVASVRSGALTGGALAGAIVSVGISCGILGINAAHELGHRVKPLERLLAKVLLSTSLYMHFFIEHNRGHHRHAATADDPATARRGEGLYRFMLRSVRESWRSAWRLEAGRLQSRGSAVLSWRNEMLWYHAIELGLVVGIGLVAGWLAALSFIGAAVVGFLLLENVNYIEHYGLERARGDRGKYERVAPRHSWNSNHPLGRAMLFELTRHSDHHAVASRPYQILRHHDLSPQLPTGYPGMMALSWLPPLWFRVMDRHLAAEMSRLSAAAN